MLKISTVRSHKKGVRVHVQRRLEKGEKTDANYPHKQIGSFLLSEGYDDALLSQLKPSEIIQLEGWLAEAQIASQYGIEVDSQEFTKHSFKVIKKLDAIAQEEVLTNAKRLGIEFNPLREAIQAYYHAVINTAKAIIKVEDNQALVERLEEIGISLSNTRPADEYQKRLALESRILFKKLLEINSDKLKTCREFEECARQYGKDKKISVGHLKEWAGEMPGHKLKELKKWYISVAIDVLLLHAINPVSLLSADKVAEYWLHVRRDKFTLAEAQEAFKKTFRVDDKMAEESIEKLYRKVVSSI